MVFKTNIVVIFAIACALKTLLLYAHVVNIMQKTLQQSTFQ